MLDVWNAGAFAWLPSARKNPSGPECRVLATASQAFDRNVAALDEMMNYTLNTRRRQDVFSSFLLASDKPMANAWLRLFTFQPLPPLPDFKLRHYQFPDFLRPATRRTFIKVCVSEVLDVSTRQRCFRRRRWNLPDQIGRRCFG